MEDPEPLAHQLSNFAWDLLIIIATVAISLIKIDPSGCLAEGFLAMLGFMTVIPSVQQHWIVRFILSNMTLDSKTSPSINGNTANNFMGPFC